METFATIFEIVMVLCFGASWPFNIIRAYKVVPFAVRAL